MTIQKGPHSGERFRREFSFWPDKSDECPRRLGKPGIQRLNGILPAADKADLLAAGPPTQGGKYRRVSGRIDHRDRIRSLVREINAVM